VPICQHIIKERTVRIGRIREDGLIDEIWAGLRKYVE